MSISFLKKVSHLLDTLSTSEMERRSQIMINAQTNFFTKLKTEQITITTIEEAESNAESSTE